MAQATLDKPRSEIVTRDNTDGAVGPEAIAEPVPRKTPLASNDPTRNVPAPTGAARIGVFAVALAVLAVLAVAVVVLVLQRT
jgi:hypothetical protein